MDTRASSFGNGRASSFEESRASSPDRKPEGKSAGGRYDLLRAVKMWLLDGKADQSAKTQLDRRTTMDRFAWWLENEAERTVTLSSLDPLTMRLFLAYLREPRPEGRWWADEKGRRHPNSKRAMRPSTVDSYYRILRAFSNFCLAEGLLDATPMKNVKTPRVPKDEVQPFTEEQVKGLVNAARASCAPERDVAVVLVLVDTGLRVSELCSLNCGDVEHESGKLIVTGKGGKRRSVYMGKESRRALWRYTERRALPKNGVYSQPRGEDPLFVAAAGRYADQRLTPNGVHNLIARAGGAAGIKGVRCSPHTLRHTFAITFLRNGGNLFELQKLMGHEDLTILKRYVALADTDVEEAHRKASPGDRLKLR